MTDSSRAKQPSYSGRHPDSYASAGLHRRALAAVGVLLDTLNRVHRVEPRQPTCALDAAMLYRASVAGVVRIIVLHLAEKYGLLPPRYHICTICVDASLPAPPPSLPTDRQAPLPLWHRIMQVYAGLGQHGHIGERSDAPPAGFTCPWSDLTAILPIDDATVGQLLALLFPHPDPAGGAAGPDTGVEEIGTTYEWLCGYTAHRAAETLVRLKGPGRARRVVSLRELEIRAAGSRDDYLDFMESHTGRARTALDRVLCQRGSTTAVFEAARCDAALAARLLPFAGVLDRRMPGGCIVASGDLYLTGAEERRKTGTHYTARWMINQIVRQTLEPLISRDETGAKTDRRPSPRRQTEAILQLKVCDMAMGCGSFLLEACRYLADRLVDASQHAPYSTPGRPKHSEDRNQLAQSYRLAVPEARRLVATQCLYGVDIDPLAVELARASLWLLVGDGSLSPGTLGRRLRCGDSLVGMPGDGEEDREDRSSVGKRGHEVQSPLTTTPTVRAIGGSLAETRPFHWPLEFAEVFNDRGGFDAIIGNPPFGNAIESVTARDPTFARYARKQFDQFARGAADYCLLFWARGVLHLLQPRGRYGWIGPTSLLSDHKPWRQWMHDHARPDVFIRFPVHAFPEARIRTTAVCGSAGQASRVLVIDHDGSPAPTVAGISWTEDLRSWHEACERAVAPVNHRPLALPDADGCQLCSLPLELFAGSTTATAYALRPYVVDARNGAGPRLVTTGALDRYSCSWGLRPIRYLKRDYTTPRWPASVDVPAEIAQARDRQQGVKILIGGLTAVIEAWLDDGGASAGTVSTWVIRPQGTMALETVFGLLAVLNSATFSRLYVERHGAKAMSGKQITIQKRALLEMPVPAPLLARNRARSPAVTCDLGETGTQLAICQRVGRLLQSVSPHCGQGLQNVSPDSGPRQNVSPDSALWPRLDKLGHLAAGLLYGQSPDASLDDYDWWCDRSGLRPDPTPMRDLVALLYAASAERALSISDQA